MRRWMSVVVVIGLAGAGLALAWPHLLAAGLSRGLRAAGFPDAQATVLSAGPSETQLAIRLDAAGADRVERLTVRHPLNRLLAGRVAAVEVAGAHLRVERDKAGNPVVAGLPMGGTGDAGGGGAPVVPVDVIAVRDLTLDLPGVAPLRVAADAAQGPDGVLSFTATATAPAGVVLTARGTHALAAGTGRADWALKPVTFAADGPGPGAVVPALGRAVKAVAGRVAAKGALGWGKTLTSSAELLLREVSASVGPVTVAGVSGVVRFASLLPPVVPAGQVVAVKLLDVGLPLTDGVLHVGLTRSGVLDVDRADWRWAGGRLSARPFEMPLAKPRGAVTLEARGLDLGALLTLAGVEGLAGTGSLNGTLPLRVAGGSVRIDQGVLEAAGTGRLSYDPASPPGFLSGDAGSPTGMLRDALTDFRYDTLRMTVDGTAGGDLAVKLAIRGANPSFYDGHPVALNLNVSGALDRILRQSLGAYRIPDTVRDRMMEFEKHTP